METTANQRFKQIRLKNKMTQTEFGEALGLTYGQVNSIENNKQKVTYEIAQKVQEVFNEDWAWLLSGKRGNLPVEVLGEKQELIRTFINLVQDKSLTANEVGIEMLKLLVEAEKKEKESTK